MAETRVINYDDIYLEPSKIRLAENLVADDAELSQLSGAQWATMVYQVARMTVAGEVFVFDQEVGAQHLCSQLYKPAGDPEKLVLCLTEKTETGVDSQLAFASAERFLQSGYSIEQLKALGFTEIPEAA